MPTVTSSLDSAILQAKTATSSVNAAIQQQSKTAAASTNAFIGDYIATTWNSSDKSAEITLSNGDLTAERTGSNATGGGVRGTSSHSSGKYYYEVEIDSLVEGSTLYVGLATSSASLTSTSTTGISGAHLYISSGSIYNGTSFQANVAKFFSYDKISVAVNGASIWYAINGRWNTGNASDITFTCSGAKSTGAAIALKNGSDYATSSDGVTWTLRTNSDFTSYNPQDVIWDGSQWVVVTSGARVYKSTDGISWSYSSIGTSSGRGITYNGTIYVIVGSTGVVYTSTDASTWTSQTSGTSNTLTKVAWSSSLSLFCAVGNTGTIITSSNGTSWTTRTSGTSLLLNDVCSDAGGFIAVGNTGTIVTSTDGSSWSDNSYGSTALLGVIAGNGELITVGLSGVIYIATDDGAYSWIDRTEYSRVATQRYKPSYNGTYFILPGSLRASMTRVAGEVINTGWDIFSWGGPTVSGTNFTITSATYYPVTYQQSLGGIVTANFDSAFNYTLPAEYQPWNIGIISPEEASTSGDSSTSLDYTMTIGVNAFEVGDSVQALELAIESSFSTTGASTTPALLEVASFLTASGDASSSITGEAIAWFYEAASVAETASIQDMQAQGSVQESATAVSAIIAAFNNLVSEAASGSETWYLAPAVSITELSLATGITSTTNQTTQALAEVIVALEILNNASLAAVLESSSGSEAITNFVAATKAVLDSAVGAISLASNAIILGLPTDSAAVSDSTSLWQSMSIAIEEGALVYVRLLVDGEVYTGWVLNTQTGAATEYQGLSFNSMAKIGDSYYGASEAGVYKMAGTTDAGTSIATYIKTGLMDFPDATGKVGHDMQKRVPSLYIACDADGDVAVKTVTVEHGIVTENFYSATITPDSTENARVLLGKGARSRYWMFELGSDAMESFDAMSLYPIRLTRRI